MTQPTIPILALKREINAVRCADALQAGDDATSHFGAVFLDDAVVDGDADEGRGGVEVEGRVCDGEGVEGAAGVGFAVEGDGVCECAVGYVALGCFSSGTVCKGMRSIPRGIRCRDRARY